MKIWLNFIMKNEEKVLLRMLNSTLQVIDGVVCVDTGSTDSSKKIVSEFCKQHNIDCEIYDHPFINFANARNFALNKLNGKEGFGIFLDCDEQFIYEEGFDKNDLLKVLDTCDFCSTMVSYNTNRYSRRSLFRIGKSFEWKGAVHEYLCAKEDVLYGDYNKLITLVMSDGASWGEGQIAKYDKHAQILLEEVRKNNDPRDIFYLAQSYRDCGKRKQAINWYKKRVDRLDGFWEERYLAQLNLAKLSVDMAYSEKDITEEFLKCSDIDSLRSEHIVNLSSYLQRNGKYQKSLIFSTYALKFYNKMPSSERVLLLESPCYGNLLYQIHNENLSKTGNSILINKDTTFNEFIPTVISAWTAHKDFAIWLVNYLKPTTVVDLGVDYGYSTYCFAQPKIGTVYGIDSFQGDVYTGLRNTFDLVNGTIKSLKETYAIDNIEIIKSSFSDAVKKWQTPIQILHIDGFPTYDAVKNDYEQWSKFVDEEGVVLIHNTQYYADIKRFFAELDLYKFDFNDGSGLGVVTKIKKIIEAIEEKFKPKPQIIDATLDLTIGYIAHDNSVNQKCLTPSMTNVTKKVPFSFIDSVKKPAENYNTLIDRCKTKYLLLVHEDVSFGSDFIDRIQKTISDNPDFGAIGAVGIDKNGVYQWAEDGKYKQVEVLDCCCILINTEHKIRFDEKGFDDFHLYVEDYCMQANSIGLKCITMSINASEANKGSGYSNGVGYFKHHSNTVNQLGYCWGRWSEYNDRLKEKWSNNKKVVDIVILSYAKNANLEQVTKNGIESLLASETNIDFNIIVVESNKNINFNNLKDTKTIHPNTDFNYNAYMNIGASECNSEYICFANNDLIFRKGWASEIIREMLIHNIDSASPFCPEFTPESTKQNSVIYGDTIRGQLYGWCFVMKRSAYNKISGLDEGVKFWFSDDIYKCQLRYHNLRHALVTTSEVEHHHDNLGISGNTILTHKEKDEFTTGQHALYEKARQKYIKQLA